MNVLELLEEIEEIVKNAPAVPLTGKVMVDEDTILEIVADIRKSLPDDVHQAKWIKEQKERILSEGKEEYEKIITEARKEADYLVENHDITLRAERKAEEIIDDACMYTKELKMGTYDYVDKMLYDMQEKMDFLNMKYLVEMYSNIEKTFQHVGEVLQENRDEIKNMAYRTQNEHESGNMSED